MVNMCVNRSDASTFGVKKTKKKPVYYPGVVMHTLLAPSQPVAPRGSALLPSVFLGLITGCS